MNPLNPFLLFLPLFLLSTLRAGAPTPEEQQKTAAALSAQSISHKIVTDDAGNVIKLAISNHKGSMKDRSAEPPTPLHPDVFRELIVQLPYLEAIGLEKQHLGDEEYALLGQLKNLIDVRLHSMNEGERKASKDAPMFINELPLPLTVLELKHNFRVSGGCMSKLKPQPALEKLEIDNGYATDDAVEMILSAKDNLRNLQLHRTTITDQNFQRIVKNLPHLEILEVRPNGPRENPITGRSLQALKNHPSLEALRLSQKWTELPYEGGLDALATIPTLKYVFIKPNDVKVSLDHPAIQKLHKARPDILIQYSYGDFIGGEDGAKKPNIDAEFNWDGGVTTHG